MPIGVVGQESLQAAERRLGRLLVGERAQQRDSHRTGVGVEGVGSDNAVVVDVLAGGRLARVVLPGPAALVDVPGLVDQEVVTDVVPALILGVVGVDRPHGGRRIGIVVLGVGVVDDELADRRV